MENRKICVRCISASPRSRTRKYMRRKETLGRVCRDCGITDEDRMFNVQSLCVTCERRGFRNGRCEACDRARFKMDPCPCGVDGTFSVRQVSESLGVSRYRVGQLIKKNAIPHSYEGRFIRIAVNDLDLVRRALGLKDDS